LPPPSRQIILFAFDYAATLADFAAAYATLFDYATLRRHARHYRRRRLPVTSRCYRRRLAG